MMTCERGEPYDARTNPDGTADPSRRLLMTLPAEDHSVRLARHAAHVVLSAWRLAYMEETAVLIVSELVTNAVRHARGTDVVEVDLHAKRTCLRIEIQDSDRHWPRPRIPGGFEVSGLGIVLVGALTDSCGMYEPQDG